MTTISHSDNPGRNEEQLQLASRLKEAREYLGFSQEQVSESTGLPRASISAIETGRRRVSGTELKLFAKIYRVPVSVLLSESNEADPLAALDPTLLAVFRAAKGLTDEDRKQVLRFTQFLRDTTRNREEDSVT